MIRGARFAAIRENARRQPVVCSTDAAGRDPPADVIRQIGRFRAKVATERARIVHTLTAFTLYGSARWR